MRIMETFFLDAASPAIIIAGIGAVIIACVIAVALIVGAIFLIVKVIKKNKK